jgi:hypothetical protein
MVKNHTRIEELNKNSLLSPTSLQEKDDLLLIEGEFTNKFIKEYKLLIENLNEKSYQNFRRIILDLIERSKSKGLM